MGKLIDDNSSETAVHKVFKVITKPGDKSTTEQPIQLGSIYFIIYYINNITDPDRSFQKAASTIKKHYLKK